MARTIGSEITEDENIDKIKVDIAKIRKCQHLKPRDWIIDSGATTHLTVSRTWFIPGTEKLCRHGIMTATDQLVYSTYRGDVRLILKHPNSALEFILTDVLYAPDIAVNLLGTIKLNRKGLGINLLPTEVVISHIKTNTIISYGDIVQDTYIMRVLDLTKPCGTHEAKADIKEILPRRETPLEI